MTEPSTLLDQLLDIKRLAESADDRGYDPFVLLAEIGVIAHHMIGELSRIDPAVKALIEGSGAVVALNDHRVLAHLPTLLTRAENNAKLTLVAATLLRELHYHDVALDLLLSCRATRKVIAEATGDPFQPGKPIVIEVRGGVVQDVLNVPPGIQYEIRDFDIPEESSEDGRPS
jgi:hypothetical protein